MDFPLIDLMDEHACYAKLLRLLHPRGLVCPRCGSRKLGVHRRHRDPILDFQCAPCGAVFNAWTKTVLAKSQWRPREMLLFLRGIAQGVPTARLARELRRDRKHLLEWRHRLQSFACHAMGPKRLSQDTQVEADEMYQNAGEKRYSASRSSRSATTARQQKTRPWQLGK